MSKPVQADLRGTALRQAIVQIAAVFYSTNLAGAEAEDLNHDLVEVAREVKCGNISLEEVKSIAFLVSKKLCANHDEGINFTATIAKLLGIKVVFAGPKAAEYEAAFKSH